jgi:hypothetical protein
MCDAASRSTAEEYIYLGKSSFEDLRVIMCSCKLSECIPEYREEHHFS